jgi:hypothetical protein
MFEGLACHRLLHLLDLLPITAITTRQRRSGNVTAVSVSQSVKLQVSSTFP